MESKENAPEVSKVMPVIPVQLDFAKYEYAAPKYKYTKILPLTGTQTYSLPLASNTEVLFEIPSIVMNLSESYLYAQVAIPQQAVGNFSWIHSDGMPFIESIELTTRSGVILCQIPNFQKYCKVMRKLHTKKSEFESSDRQSWFYPYSNLPAASSTATNITGNNGPSSNLYNEPQYMLHSIASAGAVGVGQLDLTMNFPLRAIKKSIFELNKNLVFPEIIVLKVTFGGANKIAYLGTSATVAATGAAALDGTLAAVAPTVFAAGCFVVLANLTLYMAVERNETLAQVTRSMVNSASGLNILIDFPYCYKQAIAASQNQNLSLRFSRSQGLSIQEIVAVPFNATESLNTAYDHFNVAALDTAVDNNGVLIAGAAGTSGSATKLYSYTTQLDNVKLQDSEVYCGMVKGDDYRENRKHFKDTCIINSRVYNQNWMHVDKFYEEPLNDNIPQENMAKGLSCIVERKWDFIGTGAGAGGVVGAPSISWITCAILQKDLHIGSNIVAFQ